MTPLRRGRHLGAAIIAMGAFAAAASPASAAPATVTVADDAFGPNAVTINAGESVTWNFNESSHNAKGDGWAVNDKFGTGSFSRTFDTAGTFSYICQAHPDMKGTVKVDPAPASPAPAAPAPTAPAPGQPTAGAAAASPAFAPVARDTAVPRVAKVRAARSRLRVVLSEDATIIVSVRRAGRQVRRMRVKGTKGANTVALKRALRRGRYAVRVVAIDAAGNESPAKVSRLRVKR
jgi:plastocyanin